MSKSNLSNYLVPALGTYLAACSAVSPTQVSATATSNTSSIPPQVIATAITLTLTPTEAGSPSPLPSVTSTVTTSSSDTPNPTSSETATLTPSPHPLATATLVSTPTATPPPPALFSETPIQTFDRDVFIQYLGLVRDSFRSAYRSYANLDPPGGCSTFNGWLLLWLAQAPGFTQVPPAWEALYWEYRSWLQQAVSTTWKHHLLCIDPNSGTLSAAEISAFADFFNQAYARLEVMVASAQQLPP